MWAFFGTISLERTVKMSESPNNETALPPVVATIDEVRQAVRTARSAGKRIGLVPTMGALHQGHVKLIEEAGRIADDVVVSLFVNPTQFGPGEDFTRYPRMLELDRERVREGGGALIFAPTVETMYPNGKLAAYVEVPGIADVLEGASRPGHFRGVATVVLKLFEIVGPDVAVFGEKDYQQLLVIRRMVADLNSPVEIVGVPTIREADGLASAVAIGISTTKNAALPVFCPEHSKTPKAPSPAANETPIGFDRFFAKR